MIECKRKFGKRIDIPEIQHKELVDRAFDYLKFSHSPSCSVIFKERRASTSETPDVIGFYGGFSYLIECKASRTDFLADRKKFFRQRPEDGMGYMRYYMAPVRLLDPDEIPNGWGLLDVYEKTGNRNRIVKIAKESERFDNRDQLAEISYLVSAIRRLDISMAVYVASENSVNSVSSVAEKADN